MTVYELEHRMSSKELSEWMAYYSLEPFGSPREDYRSALVGAIVSNSMGGGKKPLQPHDIIKPFRPEPRRLINKQEVDTGGVFNETQRQQMFIFQTLAERTKGSK